MGMTIKWLSMLLCATAISGCVNPHNLDSVKGSVKYRYDAFQNTQEFEAPYVSGQGGPQYRLSARADKVWLIYELYILSNSTHFADFDYALDADGSEFNVYHQDYHIACGSAGCRGLDWVKIRIMPWQMKKYRINGLQLQFNGSRQVLLSVPATYIDGFVEVVNENLRVVKE